MDGASMIRTFWTVGVVAARPAAAMLFLFTFVGAWNNFFWPFIVLDRQSLDAPCSVGAAAIELLRRLPDRPRRGVLLATIPLILLFIVAGSKPSAASWRER